MIQFTEALDLARKPDVKGVRCLLLKFPFFGSMRADNGESLLSIGFSLGASKSFIDLKVIKKVIESGCDVANCKSPRGESLLFLALKNCFDPKIIGLLRKNGAQMTKFEEAVRATSSGHTDKWVEAKIRVMLRKNPELPFQRHAEGQTLLHHAVRSPRISVVRMLVRKGADTNAITSDGDSPLGLLNWRIGGDEALCHRYLIRHGAKYTEREMIAEMIDDGDTHGVITRIRAKPKLVNTWLKPRWPLLHYAAAYAQEVDIVVKLIELGANVNLPNEAGLTPLHRAARRSQPELFDAASSIIRLLISNGAKINAQDEQGRSPLHEAACCISAEPMKLLLELGADINQQDKIGTTPLYWVYACRFLGWRSLAKYLKSVGAK